MFLAQQQSEFFQLLQSIDSDFVEVVMIISTVMTFVTLIVLTVTIGRTIQDIALVRSNRKMIGELLAKGYTVDEVERLVYGNKGWGAFSRVVGRCRQALRQTDLRNRQPSPPVKTSV